MMARKFTGRDMLVWLIASFAVVLAVNVYFIVLSVQTFSGEDEQKPYLQGVEYNRTLARRAEQKKLGWNASIGAERLASGAVRIAVTLKQADGSPQTRVTLAGELRHPANEKRDRLLQFREAAPGNYETVLSGVAAGTWDVIVRAQRPAPFEAGRRLWVR
jgi:nitrogen fixation protein FixH